MQIPLFSNPPSASISPCGLYRYTLNRSWDASKGKVVFVALNPSTATDSVDDPTMRRMKSFATTWGYGSMCIVNLFAFRATNPSVMKKSDDPVGPMNDEHLLKEICEADLVIACWGTHGGFRSRDEEVLGLLSGFELMCLGITKGGFPKHPLYLTGSTEPQTFDTKKP